MALMEDVLVMIVTEKIHVNVMMVMMVMMVIHLQSEEVLR